MKFGVLFLAFTLVAIVYVEETNADHESSWCWISHNTLYVKCNFGCCGPNYNHYCCTEDEDEDDHLDGIIIFLIVASSIGGLIMLVSVIITIVCIAKGNCCRKTFHGRVHRAPAIVSPGVVHNTYSQTTYLPQTQPSAPNYNVQPPPYLAQPPPPPVYQAQSDVFPTYPGTVDAAPPRHHGGQLQTQAK